MDARARDFAGGIKAGNRAAAPKVGADAAHKIMRSRRNRQQIVCDIQPRGETGRVDLWKAFLQKRFIKGRHIQKDGACAGAAHLGNDRT